MLVRIVLSFIIGSALGNYGINHGWTPAELVFVCLPLGILISLGLNLLEGNFKPRGDGD